MSLGRVTSTYYGTSTSIGLIVVRYWTVYGPSTEIARADDIDSAGRSRTMLSFRKLQVRLKIYCGSGNGFLRF